MEEKFRTVLSRHLPGGGEEGWSGDDKLKELGLDSMASIRLLADLEEEYGVSIPDERLVEETFSTPNRLWEVVKNAILSESGER